MRERADGERTRPWLLRRRATSLYAVSGPQRDGIARAQRADRAQKDVHVLRWCIVRRLRKGTRYDIAANRIAEQRRDQHRDGGSDIGGLVGQPQRLKARDVGDKRGGGAVGPLAHYQRRL